MNILKKTVRRILKILVALFVLLNLLCMVHGWKLTHFYDDVQTPMGPPIGIGQKLSYILFGPKAGKSINDKQPPVPYTTTYISTIDQQRIELWELKADSTEETIVLFHGHGAKKSSMLPQAMQFYNWGYNVVMVDFRAHGGSEGNQCTIGIKEAKDVEAAYRHVKNKTGKEPVLWGISLGAAAIMRSVWEFNLTPRKLVLEMPYASLYDAVVGRIKIMNIGGETVLAPLLTFWGGAVNGVWAFGQRPYIFGEKIDCPVLLQWGRNDLRVTAAETNKIARHIASSTKRLIVYENSGHESLYNSEPVKWNNAVSSFLKEF
jgi:alpha-beta hydrolase superfamily lysophospholipase